MSCDQLPLVQACIHRCLISSTNRNVYRTDTGIRFCIDIPSAPHAFRHPTTESSRFHSPKNAYSIAFFNLTTKFRHPLERSTLADLAVTEDVSCSQDPDAGHGCNGIRQNNQGAKRNGAPAGSAGTRAQRGVQAGQVAGGTHRGVPERRA
jgi:hypothetical protein